MKFSRTPFLQNYSGKIDEKRISIWKKSLVKHSEVLSEREILQKKGINSINESNQIFSEAMKNVSELIVILSKGMRASMLMIKKKIIILEMSSCFMPPTRQNFQQFLRKKLLNFMTPFYCLKATEPLRGQSFLFPTNTPGVSGSHLIDLEG